MRLGFNDTTIKELSGFFDYTDSTGEFNRGKTLRDVLQLFLVPAILIFGAYWLAIFTTTSTHRKSP
jgi:Ca2+/H+ antiporter